MSVKFLDFFKPPSWGQTRWSKFLVLPFCSFRFFFFHWKSSFLPISLIFRQYRRSFLTCRRTDNRTILIFKSCSPEDRFLRLKKKFILPLFLVCSRRVDEHKKKTRTRTNTCSRMNWLIVKLVFVQENPSSSSAPCLPLTFTVDLDLIDLSARSISAIPMSSKTIKWFRLEIL